ncbi:glycosyltransferase family 25 protein [Pseudochrobactrum sp. HB0163]|uniref:glycosyltransferase family 25 protein n=1 Tax=Pseudochrobactrum sp. HB0163 TaxID=3450708 RepID=UPI003F6DEC76
MAIFVINLERRPERLAHIGRQLRGLGLGFTRVDAVDGIRLAAEEREKYKVDPNWPRPSDAEFACFMSHRKCWQQLLQSGEKYAVVMEDDVVISPSAEKFLAGFDWVPPSIELLRFETGNIKANYKRWGAFPVLGRSVYELASFHFGTGAYLISRKLAGRLLALSDNYIPVPIDHFLFDPDISGCHGGGAHQLVPAICIQERFLEKEDSIFEGDIEGRSVYDARMKNRPKISGYRKIIREIKKGLNKAARFPFEKRFIVPYE